MKTNHDDHHGTGSGQPCSMTDLEKSTLLLAHMLDHNRHHEEEMAALAERFEKAEEPLAAKKLRIARARMVEANLALLEALNAASAREDP